MPDTHTDLRAAASKVVEGFTKGFFTRSTKGDGESDWAVKLLPYIAALGKLSNLPTQAGQEPPEGPWEAKDINDDDRCWGPTVFRNGEEYGACNRSRFYLDTMTQAIAVRDALNHEAVGRDNETHT